IYLTEEGSSVTTTVGAVDKTRLSKGLPVRSPRSYARQRHYPGLFWSATTGSHVPYESRLELDRLRVADFDSRVVWISGQPMWLSGRDGGPSAWDHGARRAKPCPAITAPFPRFDARAAC